MNNWDSMRLEQIEENTREVYKALDRFALAMERIADALDRKTEPNCSEKPNNCEPQRERYCTNCKHNGVIEDYECRECNGMDNHEFIEPQTDCAWK